MQPALHSRHTGHCRDECLPSGQCVAQLKTSRPDRLLVGGTVPAVASKLMSSRPAGSSQAPVQAAGTPELALFMCLTLAATATKVR